MELGEFDWSTRIEDATAGGATGTEALMRLRFALRQLLESDAAIDLIVKDKSEEVMREITRILGS